MKIKIALLLGGASCLVIAGGVVVSLMLYWLAIAYKEGVDSEIVFREEIWIFGLPYIISGIVGLVAGFVQNRIMYMMTCIFVTISGLILLVTIPSAEWYLLSLVVRNLTSLDLCEDVEDNCKCRLSINKYESTPFKTCAYFKKFGEAADGIFTFERLTVMAQTAEFALAIYYYLPSKPSAGVVSMPSQQSMLEPGPYTMPQAYGQPETVMMPQAYVLAGPYMSQAYVLAGPYMSQAYVQAGPYMSQAYVQPGTYMSQAYVQPGTYMMPPAYSQPGPDMMPQAYSRPGSNTML